MLKGFWLHLKDLSRKLEIRILFLLVLCLTVFQGIALSAQEDSLVSLEKINKWASTQTGDAQKRFIAWGKLIQKLQNKSLQEKLSETNDFINMFHYESDQVSEKQADYWKSPYEFMVDAGGDCEDFAIAKYFTLLAEGVAEDKLRITYVKAVKLNIAHMVLTYYAEPGAEPLVLDNLNSKVLPASKRPDLIPVYSFNGSGLWLAVQKEKERRLGNPDGLNNWQGVIEKLKQEGK